VILSLAPRPRRNILFPPDLAASPLQCPDIRIVRSTGAHRAPVKVKQTFIECKPAEKLTLLVSHLTEALSRSNMGSVIVFCNTTASASFVHEQLKAKGVSHASFHGDLPQATRNEQLASFMRGDEYVLVSTDVMARGLDFANLNTVINFDFPNSSVDYIHRIGRTGFPLPASLPASVPLCLPASHIPPCLPASLPPLSPFQPFSPPHLTQAAHVRLRCRGGDDVAR